MKKFIGIALFAALLSPTLASASFDVSLKYGMSGAAVYELQELLASEDCLTVTPTGYFGALTLNAVKCFQLKHELPSTGYFGVMSRGVANTLVVSLIASSTQAEVEETGTTTVVAPNYIIQPTQIVPVQEPVVGSQIEPESDINLLNSLNKNESEYMKKVVDIANKTSDSKTRNCALAKLDLATGESQLASALKEGGQAEYQKLYSALENANPTTDSYGAFPPRAEAKIAQYCQ